MFYICNIPVFPIKIFKSLGYRIKTVIPFHTNEESIIQIIDDKYLKTNDHYKTKNSVNATSN